MNRPIDFPALQAIGLGPAMQARLANGVADPLAQPMRLVEVQRAHWLLHDGHHTHRARCATALQQDLLDQGEALAVGDRVLARPADPGGCCITCRLLPVNQLTRRTGSGGRGDPRAGVQRQALVSNVDTALLVMGLDHDFQLRRLECYLALVQLAGGEAGVATVLVLSKADTVPPTLAARRLAEAADILPPRMPALALDVRQPDAAGALSAWLQPGQTLVLLGSSGAGKSTLANTLVQAHGQLAGRHTGAVRADDSRGRHTTTVRSLLPLPGGACVIDPVVACAAARPGRRRPARRCLRRCGPPRAAVPLCRFRDCQHQQEPGCAVRLAVDTPRLENHHKLLREACRDTLTALERQAQQALWKQRNRAGAARARAKRQPDA